MRRVKEHGSARHEIPAMNTNEFTQRAMADPWGRDPDFIEALRDPEHRKLLDDIQAFDVSLKSALQVDAPEGLADRIKARNRYVAAAAQKPRTARFAPRRQTAWRFAMAAGLVLSIGLAGFFGIRFYKAEHQLELLQTAVLRHSYHEPWSWMDREVVDGRMVRVMFHGFGVDTVRDIERVTYVSRCRLDDHDGVHLVILENGRPITVYYMPREPVNRESTMRDQRFAGLVVPGGERGSWAVVVERDTPMADARNVLAKVRSAVQFRL